MSEATQTQTQTPTIEQTLNKTDFGHVLYENRKLLFSLLAVILLGVTGYVIWKQTQKSQALNDSVKVFEFQSQTWQEAKAGKIAPADLVKTFIGLDENVRNAPVMLPVVLDMGKFLFEKGNLAEADTILSKVGESTKHPVGAFFVTMQRAVVLEKLGKLDEAIKSLETLAASKEVLMPAKVSMELGRLYALKGEKGKAQTQFENVVNTYPNDDQAKLAKLYLAQLAQ